jgi:hypothetical protein
LYFNNFHLFPRAGEADAIGKHPSVSTSTTNAASSTSKCRSPALPDLPDRCGPSRDLRQYRVGVDLAQSLHEFTAADPDGNLLRVFYDFAWETRLA